MPEKRKNTRVSSSRECSTSVENMVTERQISGEIKIKETKTRTMENSDFTYNLITLEKGTQGG